MQRRASRPAAAVARGDLPRLESSPAWVASLALPSILDSSRRLLVSMMLHPRRLSAHHRVRRRNRGRHCRAPRRRVRPRGARRWRPGERRAHDYPYFLDWDADCIADRAGRSRGAPAERPRVMATRSASRSSPTLMTSDRSPELWGEPVVLREVPRHRAVLHVYGAGSRRHAGRHRPVLTRPAVAGRIRRRATTFPHRARWRRTCRGSDRGGARARRRGRTPDRRGDRGARAVGSRVRGRALVPWIVFAGGALLIVIAWTWSLRVRPLGRPRRTRRRWPDEHARFADASSSPRPCVRAERRRARHRPGDAAGPRRRRPRQRRARLPELLRRLGLRPL